MSPAASHATRMLLEPDAAELLANFGIPYVEHGVSGTAADAVVVAARIGYPVVLKVISEDIVHKSDVDGVVTGLDDEAALRDGFAALLESVRAHRPDACVRGVLVGRHVRGGRELIVGATHDPTFGPTVMVGLGGVFAEALGDVAFRLAPLLLDDAADMLRELRGFKLLAGYRGEGPVDVDAAARLVVKVGDLICSHPEIQEIDLNPVTVSAHGCVALDARIIVRHSGGEVERP